MPRYTTRVATTGDRYVTPTMTWKPGACGLSVSIPTIDDASAATLEISPLPHAFNYPYAGGAKPIQTPDSSGLITGLVSKADYAQAGVVAEFRFDDADGTTIQDSVHGIVLTEQGDPTFQATTSGVPGLGKGITFDGTGDAFDGLVQDIPEGVLPTTGDFSVEFVGNLTSASGGAGDTLVCARTGAAGVGWQLQLDANEYLDVHIEDADGEVAQAGATDVCTDAVVHILCSFDRDGNLVTYINGAAAKTTDISSKEKTIRPATGAANMLCIGGDPARTAGDVITGTVYFVRIYNRALTAANALENYNAMLHMGGTGFAPLLDFFDGDDLAVLKSGSQPGTFVFSEDVCKVLQGNAFRVAFAVEQATTPINIDVEWVFS